MCDEYDEERLREFWRRLAMQEASSDLEEDRHGLGEPLGKPADAPAPPSGRTARAVLR